MIHNSQIFNSIIPEGFYFAKVIEIETEPSDFKYPKILIKLKIHKKHNLNKNIFLYSIIHPTKKSKDHYEKFIDTFLCYKDTDFKKAINRIGSIWVYRSEFNDTVFSSVKFVYQPRSVKIECLNLEEKEREGGN